MLTVPHYGVHFTEGGIGLLVQEDGAQLAVDVPFDARVKVVKPRRTLRCPHNLNLSSFEEIELGDDPLMKLFLPIPKDRGEAPIFLRDDDPTRQVLKQLMRLSNSVGTSSTAPLWLQKPALLMDQLHLTNIQPFVVYGYSEFHHTRLQRMIDVSEFAPRRLVVLLPEMHWMGRKSRLETSLSPTDLSTLPLERVGAQVLRQFMLTNGV